MVVGLRQTGRLSPWLLRASAPLPTPFTPVAWLGPNDVIGTGFVRSALSPCGDETVGVLHLTSRPPLEDWGFSGSSRRRRFAIAASVRLAGSTMMQPGLEHP